MIETRYVGREELDRQRELAARVRELNRDSRPSYHIEAYGCQMNVRDAETLAGMFSEMGFVQAESMKNADLILFHTCCVRDHAEKRVFGNIGALKEWKAGSSGRVLAVSGCMVQQPYVAKKLFARFPFVDIVFGTHVMYRLPEMLCAVAEGERVLLTDEEGFRMAEGLPSLRKNPYSAFVNIMYGCDNFCSYCIVPYVRGRERSRAPEDVYAEVQQLCDSGVSEITLLGQNVNSYGKGCTDTDFPELLTMLSSIDGLRRLRFMTSHPKDLSEKLVMTIAQNRKLCRHIHLPAQSGSDRILAQMNRRYTAESYLEKVALLRRYVPDIAITTDLIVGFPGESDADFQDTLALVKRAAFSSAFTFKYSPRRGTKASQMPDQVPEEVKKERLACLNEIQQHMSDAENAKMLGKSGEILVEGFEQGGVPTAYGKLSDLKMVYVLGGEDLVGTYQQVIVTGCKRNSLTGRIV